MTISDLLQFYAKYRRALIGLSLIFFSFFMIGLGFLQLRAYEAEAATYDPDWIKCDNDQSCTALPGACGEWMPVNTESTGQAAAYYKRLSTMIKCVSTIDAPDKPGLICLHEKCTFGVRAAE